MQEAQLWSLGSSGSYDGSFNPLSLNDVLGDGSLGAAALGLPDLMDVGDDAPPPLQAPAPPMMQMQPGVIQHGAQPGAVGGGGTKRPRVSFPDHPGPVVPLRPTQLFEGPLTPQMSVNKSTMELLNKVLHFQTTQRVNLDKLRLAQWQILSRPTAESLAALLHQETQMKNDTWSALQALVYAWCQCMLSPLEIWRWEFLYMDLQIQYTQIELYLNEAKGDNGPLCAFALISHPFPVVATRGRTLEGPPMVVQLLTGATVDVQAASAVRAECVIPKVVKGKMPPDLTDISAATLQPETRHAEFKLKFANGTRKQPVQFQFHAEVTLRRAGGTQAFQVSSPVTPPTISVTNEVQWEEAEGLLIERVAFGLTDQVCTWSSLCNFLQRHLINATRQHVLDLHRIFSLPELVYFHKTFFRGATTISVAQFEEFWRWYGKAAHKIRYTKHVLALFLNGLLFGFIAKDEMERALQGRPAGTFMIRFSERNAGSFSIAYVTQDQSDPSSSMVRHYLVSHEDITQRKSLAEFLSDSPALTHFLRYEPKSGFNLAPSPIGVSVQFSLQEKYAALHDFVARRDPVQQTLGYDSQLNPQPPAHVFQRNLQEGMGGHSVLGRGVGSAAGSVSPSLAPFSSLDFNDVYDAE